MACDTYKSESRTWLEAMSKASASRSTMMRVRARSGRFHTRSTNQRGYALPYKSLSPCAYDPLWGKHGKHAEHELCRAEMLNGLTNRRFVRARVDIKK